MHWKIIHHTFALGSAVGLVGTAMVSASPIPLDLLFSFLGLIFVLCTWPETRR